MSSAKRNPPSRALEHFRVRWTRLTRSKCDHSKKRAGSAQRDRLSARLPPGKEAAECLPSAVPDRRRAFTEAWCGPYSVRSPMPPPNPSPDRLPWGFVGWLSVAQLISWGVIFYAFTLFIEPMAQELRW